MAIPPFPTHIQIQTTTACGADCAICPHPQTSPNWSNGPMDDALFDRIVDQLAGQPVEYLCPYLMADGLSDKKIFDRVAALRQALPRTHFEISTTGMYLVPRIADRLLQSSISELRISSHGISADEYARTMPGVDFDKAMTNIDRFIRDWQQDKPFKLTIVCLWGLWSEQREAQIESYWRERGVELSRWRVISRGQQVDLTVFGDAAPDPRPRHVPAGEPPYTCRFQRDTQWMHILSDGRVTLCCMDYRQEQIVGDARRDSLADIWNAPAFERVRAMVCGDRPVPDDFLCNRCEWHVAAAASSRTLQAVQGAMSA